MLPFGHLPQFYGPQQPFEQFDGQIGREVLPCRLVAQIEVLLPEARSRDPNESAYFVALTDAELELTLIKVLYFRMPYFQKMELYIV